MQFNSTPVADLYVVELEPRVDARGFFARAWCSEALREHGVNGDCAQVNVSCNHRRGTLRGMHFQLAPHAEAKLVRVIRGAVHDVGLDLRPDSRTYGQWFATELSAENRRAVFVPEGCAHGYLTLTDDAEVLYLVSMPYHAAAARGIMWNTEMLRGAWPFEPRVISDQDRQWPLVPEPIDKRLSREGLPMDRGDLIHRPHPAHRRRSAGNRKKESTDLLHPPTFQFVPDLRSQFVLF